MAACSVLSCHPDTLRYIYIMYHDAVILSIPVRFGDPSLELGNKVIFSTVHLVSWLNIPAFDSPTILYLSHQLQWNLVIKRSDITKPSYNKVIFLVPALYIYLFFYPDMMRNLIKQGNFHGPKDLVITRFHCININSDPIHNTSYQ